MKKRKAAAILIIVAILATSICGCSTSGSDAETEVANNQRLAYAVVTAIEGNEMTYMEVDESQLNLSSDGTTNQSTTETNNTEAAPNDSSSDTSGKGGMGGAPSGDMSSTEMPQMDGTEMPSEGGSNTDTSNMTGTTATVQIPVGITVHTTADTDTTFSRIASGDILKILFETDEDGNEVIIEIWMVK